MQVASFLQLAFQLATGATAKVSFCLYSSPPKRKNGCIEEGKFVFSSSNTVPNRLCAQREARWSRDEDA